MRFTGGAFIASLLSLLIPRSTPAEDAGFYLDRGNVYRYRGKYDRAIAFYLKKEYARAADDVNKAQSLGHKVHPVFLQALREASGRER